MRNLLPIIFVLIGLCSYAQGNSYQDYSKISPEIEDLTPAIFSIKIGPSVPLGNFGEVDANSPTAGQTNTGLAIAADFRKYLNQNMFFIAEGKLNYNGLVESEFLNPIRQLVPPTVSLTMDSDNWRNRSLMVGFGASADVGLKASFYFKSCIGIQSSVAPRYDITLSDGSANVMVVQSEGNSQAFVTNVGGGFLFDLSGNTKFLVGLDYLNATHDFENITVDESANGVLQQSQTFEFQQNVNIFNLYIGLAFQLK